MEGSDDGTLVDQPDDQMRGSVVGGPQEKKKRRGMMSKLKRKPKESKETPGQDLDESVINEALVEKDQWQKRPYCQICFAMFTKVSLTQHHCRMCGRSICHYCSS